MWHPHAFLAHQACASKITSAVLLACVMRPPLKELPLEDERPFLECQGATGIAALHTFYYSFHGTPTRVRAAARQGVTFITEGGKIQRRQERQRSSNLEIVPEKDV